MGMVLIKVPAGALVSCVLVRRIHVSKRESLWEAYLAKGMSRRSFLKGCVTLTSLMGLSTDMMTKVVEAAETKPLPVVIWLHGH